MNYREKSKDELIKELQKLQLDYDSLKTLYEKDIFERKRTEELQAMILRSIPLLVYYSDTTDNYAATWISENVKQVTGFDQDVFLKEMYFWSSRLHPDDRDRVLRTFNELQESEKGAIEYRWQCANGEYHWFLDSFSSFKKKQESKIEFIGIWLDITERKKAEKALHVSEDLYRDLVENSQDLICTHDLEGHILSANPWAAKVLGYEMDTILQMNIRDFLAPEVRRGVEAYLAKIRKNGTAKGLLLVRTATGERRIWEYNNTLRTEGVSIPVVRGMARDITERKHIEEALQKSEERFRALIESSSDVTTILDAQGTVLYHSPNYSSVWERDPSEEIGKDMFKDVHPDDIPLVNDAFIHLLKNPKDPVHLIVRAQHTDGTWRALDILGHNHLKNPALRGIVVNFHDITDRKQAEEALIESEKRYRELFNNISSGVAIYEVKGNGNDFIFKDFNRAGERIDGDRKENIIGKSIYQVRPGINKFGLLEVFKRVFATGIPEHYPARFYVDEKLQGWYDNFVYRLTSGEIVAVYDDITKRKLAEEALRQSEMKLKTLFEVLPIGISILDKERTVAFVNPAMEKILHMTKEGFFRGDYKSRKYFRPDGTQMPEEEFASVRAIREQRAVHNVETGVLMEDGHVIWTNVNAAPVAFPDWKVVIISTDITEHKLAEEALHLEKENFRHSLDDSPLGVRIVTMEGKTIYANQAIINIYGYDSLEELQKTPLKDRYTPESYIEAQERKRLRESGDLSATDYEISIVRKNGEIRHLYVHRKEVLWNGVKQFQVIYKDITDRKQAEEEVIKSKNLLEDLHKHLNDMRENERASISREIHDQLGQSMTALKLDLNRMHKYIDTNPEAVTKLESMIELVSNTIKDVQRISSDLRPGILDELGLVSAIEWYCDEFEKRTGIKYNLKLDDSDYNNSQINLTFFRVLQETLTNVIRHAKASSVSIKLHQLIKGVTMTIQDNGIGIPEEKIRSTKSLGLISMRERVKQFNGTIDISSKKDKGTRLVIFIPS